jgi:hypothetical protein
MHFFPFMLHSLNEFVTLDCCQCGIRAQLVRARNHDLRNAFYPPQKKLTRSLPSAHVGPGLLAPGAAVVPRQHRVLAVQLRLRRRRPVTHAAASRTYADIRN